MKIDPRVQRHKCRPVTLVSGNIRYMRILMGLMGFLLSGTSNESGVVDNGNFWRFEWLLLLKLRDKASNIICRHVTPCWPVTDCKMNDLG